MASNSIDKGGDSSDIQFTQLDSQRTEVIDEEIEDHQKIGNKEQI